MLHSGEQNQKWPTSGLGGYQPGVPGALEWGTTLALVRKWACGYITPISLAGPQRFIAVDKIRSAP